MGLVEALREVPEKHLKVVDLAWQVTREDGTLDYEKAAFLKQELEAAFQEAEAYHNDVRKAVLCLMNLALSWY